VCHEGLARFCTEPYCAPTSKNAHKVMSHLTNYSLNKRSGAFVKCKEDQPGSNGGCVSAGETGAGGGGEAARADEAGRHGGGSGDAGAGGGLYRPPAASEEGASKRTLSHTLGKLREQGVDVDGVWQRVKGLVRRTCLAMQPLLRNATQELAHASAAQEGWEPLCAGQCFHLIGFDIMLDDAAACHLLEINCSPRLGVDGVELIDKEALPANPKDICRCPDDPRPHTHYTCEIDRVVKSHVLGGALLLLARQRRLWGRSAVSRELSNKLTAGYDKVIGGGHARGRTMVRPGSADSQEEPAGAGEGAEGDEGAEEGGGAAGGEGDFSLLQKVQELYVRVGGSKRKIDGA